MTRYTIAAGSMLGLGLLATARLANAQLDVASNFQNRAHLGVGYVVNAPHIFAGVNAFALRAGGFLVYADFKFTMSSPGREATCCPYSLAEAQAFGDWLSRDESAWRSANVALGRVVGQQLAVYAGAGLTWEHAYQRYVDQSTGARGAYWVDLGPTGPQLNMLGGLLFHAYRHLAFVVGGETRPRGFTVGLTLMVPR